jgi:hypothetical protein
MANQMKRTTTKRTKQSATGRSALNRTRAKREGQTASKQQKESPKREAKNRSSTTPNTHRSPTKNTTVNKLDNVLDISATFAVYAGRVELVRLESSKLRWVGEAGPSAGLPLCLIIKDHVVQALNHEGPSLDEISEAIRQAVTQIRIHLEREFGIFCGIRLNFVFEEQEKESLKKLPAPLRIENAEEITESLRRSCGLGSLVFVDIKEVSLVKAGRITEKNFQIQDPKIEVLPGNEICFVIHSKEPLICREFQIFCREHQVLRHQMPVHFDADSNRTIRLPGIPVAMYRHLLWEQSGELSVRLVLEGRNDAITLSQRLQHQHIEINNVPASLFLDVGSAYTKFMVVEISADLADTKIEQSELATRLRVALERSLDGSAEHISLEEPQVTQRFTDNYGLSHAPKKILDEYDDERLAAHFAGSISGLAARFYKREKRLISEIYWAFPNTKERDFVKISREVNRTLGGTTMGAVTIVPEADCLRSEFAGVLNALADAARSAKRHKEDVEKENKKAEKAEKRNQKAWDAYQDRTWLGRIWQTLTGDKPTDPARRGSSPIPIPSLENWQSEFSRLECDARLSDFLVFDAGGYSLDVYATFSEGGDKTISKSFKAGSNRINSILTAQLRKNNPDRSEQEYTDAAEDVKRLVCSNPEENEGHDLYNLCQTTTRDIYEKPIQTILGLIQIRAKGKGIPIILTGGGSRNQFLHRLLEEKLLSMNINSVPINSPLLYCTMHQAGGAKSTELKLFLCMASAFNSHENTPRMAPTTDILGGLVQIAIGK